MKLYVSLNNSGICLSKLINEKSMKDLSHTDISPMKPSFLILLINYHREFTENYLNSNNIIVQDRMIVVLINKVSVSWLKYNFIPDNWQHVVQIQLSVRHSFQKPLEDSPHSGDHSWQLVLCSSHKKHPRVSS